MEIVRRTPANSPEMPDYIFREGRRHVRPYYFQFISHVNKRWTGKTIVDLFADDFKGRSYDYYVNAVNCGRIQVDGETVPVSYIVKNSQKVTHFVHRHEAPVDACSVTVLQKDPDVVTVNKPATIPVHPCGRYRKNTILEILRAEHDLAPLFHRLVSGLLILARSASKANLFRQDIVARRVQKEYVARVVGVFPEDELVVDVNIHHDARVKRSTTEIGDSLVEGKAACTKFTRISTNGTESIILCKPITGRTHQIRVHLQYTGYPIANDGLYLTKHVPDCSSRMITGVAACTPTNDASSEALHVDSCKEILDEDFDIDPMCKHCPNLVPKGYEEREAGLWLHCTRYSGPDWEYECPLPDWADLS